MEIVAVADPDRRAAAVVAAKLGASSHARLGELLAATPLHGIIICPPADQHEEAVALAAQAGLTALVEKPPAPDAAGALRIAALHPQPWIAFNRRFDQGLALAGRVPAGGDLEIRMVLHYRRSGWRPRAARRRRHARPRSPSHRPRAIPDRLAPLAVRATATRDRAGLVLATARAKVQIECATDRQHRELVEIRRAGGGLVGRAASAGKLAGALARLRPSAHPLVRSLALQLEAYARALRGEDPGPLATAAEGAAVMRVMDAARRSDNVGGDTVAVEGVTVA